MWCDNCDISPIFQNTNFFSLLENHGTNGFVFVFICILRAKGCVWKKKENETGINEIDFRQVVTLLLLWYFSRLIVFIRDNLNDSIKIH